MRKRSVVAAAIPLSLALVGCGSSSSHSATSPATPTTSVASSATLPTSASTSAPSASTAPTTVAAAPSTTTPSDTVAGQLFVTGPVPAVTGATDLKHEPVVAAGTSPAPTVLTARDLVVGHGATAVASDTVRVQYVGAFYDNGKVFDASWTDSGPATFPLSEVVPGFKDAIIGMKVGGRREVVIPPALGYGANGEPPTIPGNSTLVFVIDLLGIG